MGICGVSENIQCGGLQNGGLIIQCEISVMSLASAPLFKLLRQPYRGEELHDAAADLQSFQSWCTTHI